MHHIAPGFRFGNCCCLFFIKRGDELRVFHHAESPFWRLALWSPRHPRPSKYHSSLRTSTVIRKDLPPLLGSGEARLFLRLFRWEDAGRLRRVNAMVLSPGVDNNNQQYIAIYIRCIYIYIYHYILYIHISLCVLQYHVMYYHITLHLYILVHLQR